MSKRKTHNYEGIANAIMDKFDKDLITKAAIHKLFGYDLKANINYSVIKDRLNNELKSEGYYLEVVTGKGFLLKPLPKVKTEEPKPVKPEIKVEIKVDPPVLPDPEEPEPLPTEKPPLGLVPRYIRVQERLVEIVEAMERYIQAACSIPEEWVDEYNDLIYEYNSQL